MQSLHQSADLVFDSTYWYFSVVRCWKQVFNMLLSIIRSAVHVLVDIFSIICCKMSLKGRKFSSWKSKRKYAHITPQKYKTIGDLNRSEKGRPLLCLFYSPTNSFIFSLSEPFLRTNGFDGITSAILPLNFFSLWNSLLINGSKTCF